MEPQDIQRVSTFVPGEVLVFFNNKKNPQLTCWSLVKEKVLRGISCHVLNKDTGWRDDDNQ